MGARGPKKLPQKLQDLKGNPEKRPRLPDAVEAFGEPVMPLWLDVYGMEIFNRIIASMPPSFYTGADSYILAMYAESCSLAKRAVIEIQEHGITVEEEKYNVAGILISTTKKKNPAHSVLADAMAKIAALGTRLGLDPTARQAITMPTPPPGGSEGFGDLIAIDGGKK